MQGYQGGDDEGAISAQRAPMWSGLHQRALARHPMFGALGGYGQRRPGLGDAMNQFRQSQGMGPLDGGARGLMGAAGAMDNPAFRQFMGLMMQRPQTAPGGGLQLDGMTGRGLARPMLPGRPAGMNWAPPQQTQPMMGLHPLAARARAMATGMGG
jgi:hypothetical protein